MKFAVFATIAIALVACAQAATVREACGAKVEKDWIACGKTLRSGKTCSNSCKTALRATSSLKCIDALSATAAATGLSANMMKKVYVSVRRRFVCLPWRVS